MDIGWIIDACVETAPGPPPVYDCSIFGTVGQGGLLNELALAMPIIATAVLGIFLVATVGPVVLKAGVALVTSGIRRVANAFGRS